MSEKFIPLKNYKRFSDEEMLNRSQFINDFLQTRRTVREFSSQEIPIEIIENCIKAAGSAPSGANKQPWHFVIVKNQKLKKEIRVAAEKEENEFYNGRATKEWLKDLEPFETNADKPFLEEAPYLIVVFEEKFTKTDSENISKNYYVKESVGIAAGMLITALHYCGLATLTHTPSPMNFLNKILNRPKNEKPFLLLVVGYPKEGTKVPDISRKSFNEIADVK